MPGLVVFKRRWTLGSDDLVLPGILLMIAHLILFIVISAYIGSSTELQQWARQDVNVIKQRNGNASTIMKVQCASDVETYSFVYLALLICAVLLELLLVGFSMQGPILDPTPRRPVAYLIYARIVLGITEVIFSIAAAINLSKIWEICKDLHNLLYIEAAIIILTFIFCFIVLLVTSCVFDTTGRSFYKLKKAHRSSMSQSNIDEIRSDFDSNLQQSWMTSLRRCCCCMRDSQNSRVALEEASHLIRDFFRDLDVVPSDILAGLILLRHKQLCIETDAVLSDQEIEEFLCGRPITNNTVYFDPTNPRERRRYENMIHYCNYAIASYGPIFYLVYNPGTGLCKLIDHCMCGLCCQGRHPSRFPMATVYNDGCCEWKTSAVRRSLKGNVDNTDLIYATWDNDVYKQPFYVCVDHDKKTVVVTIRGTLSEIDALTDIVATSTNIPVDGNDGSWKGHKGMVKGATYIKNKLIEDMILSQAFGHDTNRGMRDYGLALVGHSLGAGVASILAIMLRPKYPHLECYAYSPPGGLLSLSAMLASKDFINTAVFGKDLIIRTGLPQLHKLRNDIMDLLHHTRNPKYQIILGNIFKSEDDRHFVLSEEPVETSPNAGRLPHNNDLEGANAVVEYEDLFPPGRILHIVYRKHKKKTCFSRRKTEPGLYCAIEADNRNDFKEILVSHNMITHHWPQELLKAMKKVLSTSTDSEAARKYSQSETLPSHARLPEHNERTKLIEQPSASQQPDIVMEALHHENKEKAGTSRSDDIDIVRAPLARIDSLSETSSAQSGDSPLSPSSVKLLNLVPTVDTIAEVNEVESSNRNSNNNVHVDNVMIHSPPRSLTDWKRNSSIENAAHANEGNPLLSEEKQPSVAINQSGSLAHRFGDYIDTVLQDPCELTNSLAVPPSNKYSRSQSMPPQYAVLPPGDLDKELLMRARFEPNLIPKPPRSNSTSRKRPTDLPIARDYASAPPSRTGTPIKYDQPSSYE